MPAVNIDIVTGTLTVGTTAISGGASGRVLYDNAGTLGELPLGTGVSTALAVNVGSTGAFVVFDGALGTPSSGTLSNATGLPISTGVSGLGTGIATWLATPSSANLASAITDETGSGALVFGTGPTFPTSITVGAASGATGTVLLKGTTSGTVTLSTADAAGTWTMKLPTSAGTSGYVLQTDGSGNTSWAAASGSPAGSNQQVQFNNSGAFGASNNFLWDGTALALGLGGASSSPYTFWSTYPMIFLQEISGSKTPGFVSYVYNATANLAGGFYPMRSRGTPGTPTAVQSGDNLGVFEPEGYDGTDWDTSASFQFLTTENWDGTHNGTKAVLKLTSNAAGGSVQDKSYDFGQTIFTAPGSVVATTTMTTGAASGTTGALLLKGTTSGTVTFSVADAAGTWTMKLPTSAGSSGQFLQTDGSGNTTWAAAGGGLTVGTTTITSGTNTRILYNNSGVLGEYTLTGTGTVVAMQTDPSLLNTATLTRTAVGTTSADGIILTNTTAAAAGAQQYSPRLRLTGQGWKTNATAASQTVDWIIENQPVQGAANPTTNLVIASQVNGGGYVTKATLSSAGRIQLPQGLTYQAPTYSFDGVSTDGFSLSSGRIVWQLGSAYPMAFQSSGSAILINKDYPLSWATGTDPSTQSADVSLYRDAAAVLALKNSTTAQTFRVYGTTTGSKYTSVLHDGTDGSVSTSAGDLYLNPTGNVKFGTHSAIGSETVTGYITIKDAGGTTRKLAVVS